MTIALMADDAKKELMAQFCTAYCRILSAHHLIATSITGRMISESTGLEVECCLSGRQGGNQQIVSRISCGEIDLLLVFRDPLQGQLSQSFNALSELVRICDIHNVPFATNIATAEVLIHGLERGDLAWRDLMKMQHRE